MKLKFFEFLNFTVFRDDCLSVRTSVAMDVLYGFVQSLDHFNGALEASVFRAQRFGRRRTERQVFTQRRTGENLHLHKGGSKVMFSSSADNDVAQYTYPFILEHGADFREERAGTRRAIASSVAQQVFVNQQSFHGVASRRVVAFGVPH